jgi:hypothetical protein
MLDVGSECKILNSEIILTSLSCRCDADVTEDSKVTVVTVESQDKCRGVTDSDSDSKAVLIQMSSSQLSSRLRVRPTWPLSRR